MEVVTTDLEAHYRHKLLSLASGALAGWYSSRYCGPNSKASVNEESVSVVYQDKIIFDVKPSSDTLKTDPSHESYTVDITAGCCSCPKDIVMDHLVPAIKKYRLTSQNYLLLYSAEEPPPPPPPHKLYSIMPEKSHLIVHSMRALQHAMLAV